MMTTTTHARGRRQRGSALIPALMVVMLMSVLCMSYLQLSLDKSAESKTSVDNKKAFYVAEAGLAEAFYGLAAGKSGNVASADAPARFGSGVFWVSAEDKGEDRVTLNSTGLAGSGRAAVSITVKKAGASVAALGMFSNKDVSLGAGALVDSYDSSVAPYVAPLLGLLGQLLTGSGAKVGSNSSISLAGSARFGSAGAQILGDAVPGPSGSVSRGSGASVTGATAPAQHTTSLPELDIPAPTNAYPLDDSSTRLLSMPAGNYGYTTLRVRQGATVSFTGPSEIVIDELRLDPGARFQVDGTNGPVKIYVRSSLDLANGSVFTTTSHATDKVSLMVGAGGDGGSDNVTVNATGPFYGLIYAPNAQVSLPSTFEVFGSLVADKLTLAANARMHFDRALLDSDSDGSLPEKLCWRVTDLPKTSLVTMKFDPLTVLRFNAVTPPLAKDAHYEVGVNPIAALLDFLAPAKITKRHTNSGHGNGDDD